jgi:glycerate 2-kinase
MNLDQFSCRTLQETSQGEIVQRVLVAALRAVDPAMAIVRHVIRQGDLLTIGDKSWNLNQIKHVWLVGAGKAGAPMAHAVGKILRDVITAGVVIVKEGYAGKTQDMMPDRIRILEAGHPLPDQRGVDATQEIVEILKKAGKDDLVICLLSGGGSALMTSPVKGISLNDLQRTTAGLLACGASIDEINTLRKHLDMIKGGGLAKLAGSAEVVSLVLSDVVGDPLEIIASGPTVADTSYYEDGIHIIERYNIEQKIPPSVMNQLKAGAAGNLPETPKPSDPLFIRVYNLVVGSNRQAALAGLAEAHACGLNPLLLTTYLQGEARQVGRTFGAIARQLAGSEHPLPRPACIAAGGETTVVIRGNGMGGRNQELALGAVQEMANLTDILLVTLATDGGDGPTDAAGAVVTGGTLRRARELGLDPDDHLERNDSYHYFSAIGDLLKPGPTQTNVNDLTFLFAF